MNNFDFFIDFPIIFVIFSLVIGLLVGSFLNVVIYRLPKMMMNSWIPDAVEILELSETLECEHCNKKNSLHEKFLKPKETFNLLLPPSACPHCGHKISALENIPIISYLVLRGRCRGCKASISMRYPLVELFCGLLTALLAWYFGFSTQALLLIFLTWGLLAMSMIDIDHQLLPDVLVMPLLWIGLIANSYGVFSLINDALWGAVIGYMILWSVNAVFKLVRGYDGMGHGDFKLLALFGAWGGWQVLPIVILLSALAGAIIGGINLALTGKNKMPFGPYLAIAGWISLLWGSQIINAYLIFSGLK